jgi:hypothetical protein
MGKLTAGIEHEERSIIPMLLSSSWRLAVLPASHRCELLRILNIMKRILHCCQAGGGLA